jgi:hypothetical protein
VKGEVSCFALMRGSSLAKQRSHGLRRWLSHFSWVGKVLTIVQPEKGPLRGVVG